MRTVIYTINTELLKESNTKKEEVNKAIGYLTTWAIDLYDHVTIDMDLGQGGAFDLFAFYKNSLTQRTYTIAAIYSEGGYSFHS